MEKIFQLLKALNPIQKISSINQIFCDQNFCYSIKQGYIGARQQLAVEIGIVCQFNSAGINHDKFRPSQHGLLDSSSHNGVSRRGVGTGQHNAARLFDIHEGGRCGPCPRKHLQTQRRRRVTDASAAINIIGMDQTAK